MLEKQTIFNYLKTRALEYSKKEKFIEIGEKAVALDLKTEVNNFYIDENDQVAVFCKEDSEILHT